MRVMKPWTSSVLQGGCCVPTSQPEPERQQRQHVPRHDLPGRHAMICWNDLPEAQINILLSLPCNMCAAAAAAIWWLLLPTVAVTCTVLSCCCSSCRMTGNAVADNMLFFVTDKLRSVTGTQARPAATSELMRVPCGGAHMPHGMLVCTCRGML